MRRYVFLGIALGLAAFVLGGVLSISGCYDVPTPACGFRCGPAGECPEDYTCNAQVGRCILNGATAICGGVPDAGVDAEEDAPPDVPLDVPPDVPPDAGDAAVDAGDAAIDAGDAAIDAGDAAVDAGDAAVDAGDAAVDAGDAGTDAGVAAVPGAT